MVKTYRNFVYKNNNKTNGLCHLTVIKRDLSWTFLVEQACDPHDGDIHNDINCIVRDAVDLAHINMVMSDEDRFDSSGRNRDRYKKEKRDIKSNSTWIEYYPAGTKKNYPCVGNNKSYAIVAFDDCDNPVWSYASEEDVFAATGLSNRILRPGYNGC